MGQRLSHCLDAAVGTAAWRAVGLADRLRDPRNSCMDIPRMKNRDYEGKIYDFLSIS